MKRERIIFTADGKRICQESYKHGFNTALSIAQTEKPVPTTNISSPHTIEPLTTPNDNNLALDFAFFIENATNIDLHNFLEATTFMRVKTSSCFISVHSDKEKKGQSTEMGMMQTRGMVLHTGDLMMTTNSCSSNVVLKLNPRSLPPSTPASRQCS